MGHTSAAPNVAQHPSRIWNTVYRYVPVRVLVPALPDMRWPVSLPPLIGFCYAKRGTSSGSLLYCVVFFESRLQSTISYFNLTARAFEHSRYLFHIDPQLILYIYLLRNVSTVWSPVQLLPVGWSRASSSTLTPESLASHCTFPKNPNKKKHLWPLRGVAVQSSILIDRGSVTHVSPSAILIGP